MKKTIWITLLAGGLAGCSTLNTVVTERSPDGSERTTTLTVRTLWDAKSDLAKFKTTNTDKTQSLGIGSYDGSSESTNIVGLVQAVATGVVRGLKP